MTVQSEISPAGSETAIPRMAAMVGRWASSNYRQYELSSSRATGELDWRLTLGTKDRVR